jgi:outer membrane murein-binding lipoprotein Lpp
MRWMTTIGAVGLAVVLAGCSSNRKAIEELRSDQRRTLGQLSQLSSDLHNLKQELRLLVRQTDGLGTSVSLLSNRVEVLEIGGGSTAVRVSTPDGGEAAANGPVAPIEARTLEELAREVADLKAEVARLRGQFVTAKEEEELRDPQETWRAINDPEKMAWRLDRFTKVWSAKLEDEATRDAFVADVAALRQQVEAMASMPREEAVAHYRAKLVARSNAETNDRMRRWFDSQVQMLDRGEQSYVDNQLATYRRYDTVLALKTLAEKYRIGQEEMRDNGLPITGTAYGWE